MNSSYGRFRHPRARARPPRSCQQLYAEGKHAEILAQVEACPKTRLAISSPKRKSRMWCTIQDQGQ
ncbi:MAG: hypothetical protein WCP70_15410 [Methanothrix sp.]